MDNKLRALVPDFLRNSQTYSLVVIDLEGRYSYVNDFFKKRFEFMNMDFVNQPFSVAIHPEDVEKCNIAAYECINNPNKVVELKVRKPDDLKGDFYWTHWEFSLFKDQKQQPLGILCIGHDITETEKVSKQAKEFIQKVETIIEEITDGFCVLNRDWEFIKMNKLAEQILGLPKEKLIGSKLWSIFPDIPEYNYPSAFRKAMNDYVTVTFEDYRADLGRWFSAVCYPSPDGLNIFFRDITQQKKNQEELKHSENKLRAILDSTTDSNVLISPEYKVLCFNKKASEVSQLIFGKPLQESADMWDYILPNDRELFYQNTQKALEGEYLIFEKEIFLTNSSIWYEVSYYPVYDDERKQLGVTFNTTNINARKKAETQLKQSETMLRILYDSTQIASTFIDKDLCILFTNRLTEETHLKIFGKSPQIGDKQLDFIVPELREEFADYYRSVLQGKSIYAEKAYFNHWWHISLFPVYDSKNNIVGISNNVKNITERKENELKILKQNETLRQIAWQQSHVIRRPVANILGIIKLLKGDKKPSREEQEKYLDYLYQSTEELDKVIHKILVKSNENE